jgi:hypothetical protein
MTTQQPPFAFSFLFTLPFSLTPILTYIVLSSKGPVCPLLPCPPPLPPPPPRLWRVVVMVMCEFCFIFFGIRIGFSFGFGAGPASLSLPSLTITRLFFPRRPPGLPFCGGGESCVLLSCRGFARSKCRRYVVLRGGGLRCLACGCAAGGGAPATGIFAVRAVSFIAHVVGEVKDVYRYISGCLCALMDVVCGEE